MPNDTGLIGIDSCKSLLCSMLTKHLIRWMPLSDSKLLCGMSKTCSAGLALVTFFGEERSRVIFQLIMGHKKLLHKFIEVSSPEAFQDGLRPQH